VTKNLTTLDRSWDWGSRDYHWSFAQGIPDSSSDFEPKPLWFLPGPHDVTLEVTQSTLWGLLYKTEAKTINVTVTVPPKPPAIILPPSDLIPGVPGPDGKMPLEDKTPPGSPKPDGKPAPAPGVPGPDGKMPVPRSQILPVPQVVIEDVSPLADGKSQDIDFSLKLPKGVQLERLEVDGAEVVVAPGGGFKLRLPVGPHTLHIEYGSTSSNQHGQVTQELMVDADQVKIIKHKTRIAPPVKVPGSGQSEPSLPTKPKDEAAEKFDKKTA
jgi:hypothetical protein